MYNGLELTKPFLYLNESGGKEKFVVDFSSEPLDLSSQANSALYTNQLEVSYGTLIFTYNYNIYGTMIVL